MGILTTCFTNLSSMRFDLHLSVTRVLISIAQYSHNFTFRDKMKTSIYLLLAATIGSSTGFLQVATQRNNKKVFAPAPLKMGFFDFKPVHGSGSASDNDLDEQWRIQQEKLAERRAHLDRAHLKAKYKGGEGKFEVHARDATRSHVDDMYIMGEEEDIAHEEKKKKKPSFAFKFPWDK